MPIHQSELKNEFFDPLFRLREVETIIRAGRSTIYKLIRAGELPAVKRGGTTLVTRSALDRYLAATKPLTLRQ
jgi:excisionase family DNA binding protein